MNTSWFTKENLLVSLSALSRFLVAGVWIAAGIPKIINTMETTQSVLAYEIFSPVWAQWIGSSMGIIEIAGGLMMLFGIFLRLSSKISIVVLVLFMIGITQAWARGLVIDCGCFGASSADDINYFDYIEVLVRDSFLIALCFFTLWKPFTKFAVHV